MNLLVISGLSGSGKTIALQALEDLNYYCVDNLPLGLLPDFTRQMAGPQTAVGAENVAVGIDARNITRDLSRFDQTLAGIRALGVRCEVVFLEAQDHIIINRFSETRRKHPLTRNAVPLIEAITAERKFLEPIYTCAELRIDTSNTNVHQLRNLIRERVARKRLPALAVQFLSFGYKHGIPTDADFVFDVRCLPNPHWDPRLRLHSGQDPEVKEFLGQQPIVLRMYEDIRGLLEYWIPHFEAENRNYLSVAVGCTGGQHRSVYLVELLAAYFLQSRTDVLVRHRELL